MEFSDQHNDAIEPTIRVTNKVGCEIFDDKVRPMGCIDVQHGKITIELASLPGMINEEETCKFLIESIGLGIAACWKAKQDAFENH